MTGGEEPPPGPPSEWDISRWYVYAVAAGDAVTGYERWCVGYTEDDPAPLVETDDARIREGPEPLHGLEAWTVRGPHHVAAEEERAREKAEEMAEDLRESHLDAEVLLRAADSGQSLTALSTTGAKARPAAPGRPAGTWRWVGAVGTGGGNGGLSEAGHVGGGNHRTAGGGRCVRR